jgi:hypothetical protein
MNECLADLQKFKVPHAKLLYMIFYFFKQGDLDYEQKLKLKEYVILDNQRIFIVLDEFERDQNINKMLEQLQKIYDDEIKFTKQNMPQNKHESNKDKKVVFNQAEAKKESKPNLKENNNINTQRKMSLSINTNVKYFKPETKEKEEQTEDILDDVFFK